MTAFGGVQGIRGRAVLREKFVVPVHQQHGVDGCIGDKGRLLGPWDDEIARMTLGERMGNFIGSTVLWSHGCGRGGKRGRGRDLYMAGFLWVHPSLEAERASRGHFT